MGTRARKDRRRAGIAFEKPAKKRTAQWERPGTVHTFGLVSRAEILAGILMRS